MSDLDLRAFRAAYGAFLQPGRILLTGHSHQAWPDVVRDALGRAFDDAARFADDKWGKAVFPIVERVGSRILDRFGFAPDDPIAFGRSTHELVFRLLSCVPGMFGQGARRPRIVTTTAEFHSLDRQLRRLEEEGVEVVWVSAHPRSDIAARVIEAITDETDLVAVSAVLFEDSSIVGGIDRVLARAAEAGALALCDAYHAFNVVPMAWGDAQSHVFATAGGYKYASFGEGVCWLRIPPRLSHSLRPVYTGWFADFAALDGPRVHGTPASAGVSKVGYGAGGEGFSGATFDPTPFYRADAVLEHFDRFGLGVRELRAISTAQTTRIVEHLDRAGIEIASPRAADARGGFVAARVAGASAVVSRLRERGVMVDSRGELLRIGPAPYLLDSEIDSGLASIVLEIDRQRKASV